MICPVWDVAVHNKDAIPRTKSHRFQFEKMQGVNCINIDAIFSNSVNLIIFRNSWSHSIPLLFVSDVAMYQTYDDIPYEFYFS